MEQGVCRIEQLETLIEMSLFSAYLAHSGMRDLGMSIAVNSLASAL